MSTTNFIDNIAALKGDVYDTEINIEESCPECGQVGETYDKREVDVLLEEYEVVIKHFKEIQCQNKKNPLV